MQFNKNIQKEINRLNILGVGVSVINLNRAIRIIDSWTNMGVGNYICVTGVHGIIESQYDDTLRKIHNQAGLVTPDGMPLVWLGRWYGYNDIDRVYGPDLLLEICNCQSMRKKNHFFYGSTKPTLDLLREKLLTKFPGIRIVGTYSPPFRELTAAEDLAVIDLINKTKPDFLWIGLSTPKQEKWMADHKEKIPEPIMIGVGAAFDFHAGVKKQAPKWMQRSGLEWFYRLITEPNRLWHRYLINNPLFIIMVIGQLLGLRKYSLT